MRAKTLTKEYNFDKEVEVSNTDVDYLVGEQAPLPKRVHNCVYDPTKTSLDYKPIVGKGNTFWSTFSPESWHGLVGEAKFLRFLYQTGNKHRADHAWKSEILRPGMLIERDGRVELVLGHTPPMVVLWPCKTFAIGPYVFFDFAPPSDDAPMYFAAFDLKEVLVIPYEFAAPIDVLVANKLKNPDVFPTCFGFQEKGTRPQTLLEAAASAGFWDLPVASVVSLAEREYNIEEKCQVACMVKLVQHILQCSEEKALLCLEKRLALLESLSCEYEAALLSEEFADAAHPDDLKEATRYCEKQASRQEMARRTQTEVLDRLKKIRNPAAAAGEPAEGKPAKRRRKKRHTE